MHQRTQEQIREYYDQTRDQDFLGFLGEVIIAHLDFEHCRDLLKEGTSTGGWPPGSLPADLASVKEEARVYMAEYGWDKVESHRGISTSRTCQKMQGWMWLLGETELEEVAQDDRLYVPYGAPVLRRICEHFGWPIPDSPEGRPCGELDCGCEG